MIQVLCGFDAVIARALHDAIIIDFIVVLFVFRTDERVVCVIR